MLFLGGGLSRQLRTIVYVDGYNLYYGELRGTPWKWLDMEGLFSQVLGPQNDLVGVRYFTARVQPTAADPNVHVRQDAYFRALEAHCKRTVVTFGHFLRHNKAMENACPPPRFAQVWHTEEKGSDVNLAVHVLNDAWRNDYDCAVVVSNDSDLAEALRLVKSQHKKVIGLITPGARKPKAKRRMTSRQLSQHADFIREIRSSALEKNQLPEQIPGTTICKPDNW